MRIDADLAAIKRDGTVVLLVIVKGESAVDGKWAAEYRRNLLGHGHINARSFFLLVSSHQIFLWRPDGAGTAAPDFEGDTAPILAPYLVRFPGPKRAWSGPSREMFVSTWLSELLAQPDSPTAPEWVRRSGLAEALRGAHLETRTAA